MSPTRGSLVYELFTMAMAVSPNKRDAWLDRQEAPASVLSEVRHLLAHGELTARVDPFVTEIINELRAFIAPGEAALNDSFPLEGTVIGAYTIERVLGVGGMGVVYLATQQSPRRHVALKVIRPGLTWSDRARRRFEVEAEALGRLKHVGIAQIYEAGVAGAERRQPFFAMEYVEQGVPLNLYVSEQQLSTQQRLAIFIKICDAVEHAHQKGVIHRDLKPSNILVSDEGQPKILDFGVARTTDVDLQVATLQTEVGQLIGTLPYMSPEQVAGGADRSTVCHDLDTRSDVYALGVILYELLAGQLPYSLESMAIYDAARAIREQAPARLGGIDRAFRGDIETIVGHALEKDRERRYRSASALADDIRRHLAHEPIDARPASTWYQVKKFTWRNKALVVANTVLVCSLFTGLAIATWGYLSAKRSEAEANKQKAIANDGRDFLTEIIGYSSPTGMLGPNASMDDILSQASTTLRRRRFADAAHESSIYAAVSGYMVQRGRIAEGKVLAEHAASVLQESDEDGVEYGLALACLAAAFEAEGDNERASSIAIKASAALRDWLDKFGPNGRIAEEWCAADWCAIRTTFHTRHDATSTQVAQDLDSAIARALRYGANQQSPAMLSLRVIAADCKIMAKRTDEGVAELERLMNEFETLAPLHEFHAHAARYLALARVSRANVDSMDQEASAAIDLLRELLVADSPVVAEAFVEIGEALAYYERFERAIVVFEEARGILTRSVDRLALTKYAGNRSAEQLMLAILHLGNAYNKVGKHEEAESVTREGDSKWCREFTPGHLYRGNIRRALCQSLIAQQKYAEARVVLLEVKNDPVGVIDVTKEWAMLPQEFRFHDLP